MTDPTTPGARRLFPVEPPPSTRFQIIGSGGAVLVRTGDLAAATIAAAAVAARRHQPAWLIAPDRWAVQLTRIDGDWLTETCGPKPAPIDAIRRVLTRIPHPQEQP